MDYKFFYAYRCWGPKCDKEACSMKIKKRSWVLTKEGLACEVKNDHEGSMAQKKEKERKM